jgi:hypothetical protein
MNLQNLGDYAETLEVRIMELENNNRSRRDYDDYIHVNGEDEED